MINRTFKALTLLAAAPLALAAQQARSLPAPDATFDEPFSQIAGLRELSNGRLIVADARDKVVQLIDLAAQSALKIGREGSGPGEFGLPMRLLTAARDTTYLFDPLNSRYLSITPDGKPGKDFRVEFDGPTPATAAADAPARREVGPPGNAPANAPRPGGTAGGGAPRVAGPGGMRFGLTMPRTSDAMGRLYFESPGFVQGPDGAPRSADSAVVTRYDGRTRKLDTLTWVKLAKNNTQVSGGQGNMRMTVGAANPLTPRDEWAVFPDGRVAVVRAADYHIDWILPTGAKQSSAPIKYSPIRITDADKKEEEELRNRARQNQMTVMVNAGPGGTQRSASMGPGANAPPLPPLTDWPEVKPPFRAGQASVWARPNGELWVRRTEPAGAKGTLYDVINARGVVTHQVRVPERVNLVGFGNGTVYTTKPDEDDLLYLQRHRM